MLDSIVIFLFFLIYGIDVFILFYFGIHTIIIIILYFKYKDKCNFEESKYLQNLTKKDFPIVTVQLPIYNEFYVVERLIESIVQLEYPKEKLQIQILDDSTDECKEKAKTLAEHFKRKGYWIEYIWRENNVGYKAGALDNGLKYAKGEFIAIFDSDFVPDPLFLKKTLGYFEDPKIGMVQTRWGHLNQDYNILTKAQSFGIDGHFTIEQVARNGSGLWMNFNGTAGIWRRDCILDAGGWENDTLTEDFDLSYRAELRGWKFKYLKDVVCKSEIPPTMNAYKSQQFRWCKGSIQTAIKLLGRIFWNPKLPWKIKAEAITHLINYSVHPLMVVNILLTAPLLLLEYWAGWDFYSLPVSVLGVIAIILSTGSIGPLLFYAVSQKELYPDWKKRLKFLPMMAIIGTGVAVVNTRAWLEAMLGIPSGFRRTPKLRIESKEDRMEDRKKYHLNIDMHVVFEIILGSYAIFCILLCFLTRKYFVLPFLFLYTVSFYFVAFRSIWDGLRLTGFFRKKAIETRTQTA